MRNPATRPDSALRASAEALVERAWVRYRDRCVGTLAALDDDHLAAPNYASCFVRDFVPVALLCLADGRAERVRGFLDTVVSLVGEDREMRGHILPRAAVPTRFRVEHDGDGSERLSADYGDRSIGRVAPMDSAMWFVILLDLYTRATGDARYRDDADCRCHVREIVRLSISGSLEVFPTLLVPDGAFMIDRRLGVYGHPLEIQVLLLRMLESAAHLIGDEADLRQTVTERAAMLREHLQTRYWIDLERLSEIYRAGAGRPGPDTANELDIHPDGIPPWVSDWIGKGSGYYAANLGPQRIDFRFMAYGNLLAIVFGLADPSQSEQLLKLYEWRWQDLIGETPATLSYPALERDEWLLVTGGDPKNRPWSYHNGGHWPVLLWALVSAAVLGGRRDLAERALLKLEQRLDGETWPEYFDGRRGNVLGRYSNLQQVWSAAGYLWACRVLDDPDCLGLLHGEA